MKKALLLTISLVVVTTLLLSTKRQSVTTFTSREGAKDDADARGMATYFSKIMNDPATGQLDLKAYYNAMAQAKASTASRSTNSVPLQWQFLGPDNIGGRTRAVLFDKNNPAKVFAAGVSGGLWISNDTGQTWTEWSGSDQLADMNIVSMCQDDSGNIYFGTGEGLYPATFLGIIGGGFPGDGMWKSTDDGNTFTQLTNTEPTSKYQPGLGWAEINRIAANPHSPDSIIAAITGGIMVSGDGGQTWTSATLPDIIGSNIQGTDVVYSSDGKKVYAAVSNSAIDEGGTISYLYYSVNGGKSFVKMSGTNGFPASGGIARIELAVSPQTPNYAYATLVNSSPEPTLYGSTEWVVRTTNGGASWDTIITGTGYSLNPYQLNGFDPTGNQGDYDLAMVVSPLDSNILFVGGIVLYRWTQSSGSLQISSYSIGEYDNDLHADIHALVFDPTSNGNRLVIGCDGGVCQTLNPYSANSNLSNSVLYSSLNRSYNVTQFYNMSADSVGILFGGTQDNGNEIINYQGNTVQDANIVIGGDGGCTQIALSNNQAYFAEIAYGTFERSSNGNSPDVTFNNYEDSIFQAAIAIVGAEFYAPFNLWENADTIAYDKLHKIDMSSTGHTVQSLMAAGIGSGEVWVTPDALVFASPTWFKLQNVPDGATITALKFSTDGKFLYVGTEAGDIYRYAGFTSVFKNSHGRDEWVYPAVGNWNWNAADSGISLIQSSYTGFSSPSGRFILSFAVDPNDSNHIIATCGNYGVEYSAWVAISHNAEDTSASGFTFTPAQGNGATALPSAPVYSSCISHNDSLILVGTQMGVWTSSDDGNTWAPNNNGLANVTTMSVKELPYYNTYALYVGTHGRGIFSTINPISPTGINPVRGQTVNNLTVFPNPLSNTGHIEYNLAREGNVIINLYGMDGNLVRVIANEDIIAGPVSIPFNVSDLANGTYIMQVVEGQYQATKKLVVLH